MANYTQLIKTINDNIKANGNQEITGPVLNAVLQAIVSGLSEGALFVGIANTTTNPPAYDGDVFYIALEPGTYSNFGVIVPNGTIGIIYNTSSGWAVTLIHTYYEIDVDTLMQESPSSEDINEAIGSFTYLKRAITVGVPFFGRGASGGNSTVAIAQVKQLSDNEVRVVMLNTGTVDGSNEPVPIIKKITNSAGQLSLSTEAPTSFVGPLSSLNTNEKGSVVEAINEVNTGLKSAVKPYVVDLTSLLAAQDSESISTAIGGIDNLNGTVQKNQVIFGTLANGTVAVGIRVLGNQTTLTYFVDSVVGLTVNEVIITNTSGTLTKTANTHAVLTENMVLNSLESDETTLPLSAAQGKVLSEKADKLNNALGKPVIETIDLGTPNEVGYFWNVNGTKTASSAWNISDSITLNKGDLLIVNNLNGSEVTSVITVVSNTGDFIDSLVAADGSVKASYSYMADKDCTVQLSYSSVTSAYIVKSSQNTAIADITTSTAALHKVYESYGAVYNKESGYWELNGLTDLTEEEMYDIWLWTHNIINQPDLAQAFSSAPIRTTFPHPSYSVYRQGPGTSLNQAAYSCKFLEIFHVTSLPDGSIKITGSSSNDCHNAFNNCLRLREITDILDVSVNVPGLLSAAFNLCAKLSKVRIKGLRQDVSFEHSPLLSYESLNYIVTSAANTSAITITVHPTTYSYLTGTAQPTAEVGGTTEEWQALVTTAQGKQISFAVPEETQSEVTE